MRYQGDGLGDEVSRAARIDCSQPVLVRPEFAPESDIKNILRKYGAMPTSQRHPHFTETDFDIDLSTAIGRIKRAQEAFDDLDPKHRAKWGSPENLWNHYRAGQPFDDRDPATKTTDDTEKKPLDKTTPTNHNG